MQVDPRLFLIKTILVREEDRIVAEVDASVLAPCELGHGVAGVYSLWACIQACEEFLIQEGVKNPTLVKYNIKHISPVETGEIEVEVKKATKKRSLVNYFVSLTCDGVKSVAGEIWFWV